MLGGSLEAAGCLGWRGSDRQGSSAECARLHDRVLEIPIPRIRPGGTVEDGPEATKRPQTRPVTDGYRSFLTRVVVSRLAAVSTRARVHRACSRTANARSHRRLRPSWAGADPRVGASIGRRVSPKNVTPRRGLQEAAGRWLASALPEGQISCPMGWTEWTDRPTRTDLRSLRGGEGGWTDTTSRRIRPTTCDFSTMEATGREGWTGRTSRDDRVATGIGAGGHGYISPVTCVDDHRRMHDFS